MDESREQARLGQGTNTHAAAGAEAGHGKGVEGAEAHGKGWALEGM